MRAALLERTLWSGAISAFAIAALVWRNPMSMQQAVGSGSGPWVEISPAADAAALQRAVERTVNRNPFRMTREPANVRFSEAASATPPGSSPAPELPVPVLVGVTGPPWQAVLENVAGRSGQVIARAGASLGTMTVVLIKRDTVIVQVPDTIILLTVKRPW